MSALEEKELREAIMDVHEQLQSEDVELRVAWLNWIKTVRRRIINLHNRYEKVPGADQLDRHLVGSRVEVSWVTLVEAYAVGKPALAKAIGRYDAWRYGTPSNPENGK